VFYIVNLVLSLVFLVAAILRRRSYPANVILLTLFTLFMSFGVATVGMHPYFHPYSSFLFFSTRFIHLVTFYSTLVVLEALSITLAIFISLTLFTIFSKRDFSGMGPFLYVILLCIVFTSFVHMILVLGFGIYSSVLDIVISVVSSIVFSLYIVYDTYMIFNRYSPEDYVPAVLDLYLDVVNLFLSLLRLLGHTQD
jgi:FtsH-binding integral membrane protein